MGNYLGCIAFERKNFNANRIANGIANEIKQSDTWGFRENITKEAYNWLETNANPLATLVERNLEGRYIVAITRGKEYGEYHIQVEWYRVN